MAEYQTPSHPGYWVYRVANGFPMTGPFADQKTAEQSARELNDTGEMFVVRHFDGTTLFSSVPPDLSVRDERGRWVNDEP